MPKSSPSVRILDDSLIDHIAGLPKGDQGDWLFLTPHPQFAGRWFVDSLSPHYFLDFETLIGRYRAVSPARLSEFLELAEGLEYEVAWTHDPTEILSDWEHLADHPAFRINSDLHIELYERGEDEAARCVEATGMLPFQVQGFNYLRATDKGGLAVWSTGTGKTILMTALTKQFIEVEQTCDLALVVVKSNNKFDTQLKFKQLGNLDSILIEGYKIDKRQQAYLDIEAQLDHGPVVAVCNYEKLRDDQEFFEAIFTERRVLIHWDEMPTKLSNRETQLYQSTRDALYEPQGGRILWKNRRPAWLRQYDYSATPIEHSPSGLFNQVRLIDPEQFPSIAKWESRHVASRSPFNKKPSSFKDLDAFGLELEHMTHQVDKTDPDIAKMFPNVIEEAIYIDWSPQDRRVYNELQEIAKQQAELAKTDPAQQVLSPLQLVGVLQMLCDAPSLVTKSAENRAEFDKLFAETIEAGEDESGIAVAGAEAALVLLDRLKTPLTNQYCQKLVKLRELLTVKHLNDKSIIFTTWNQYGLPVLEEMLDNWGITYVVYKGTDKQRFEAKERFRSDPSIQVLLSSDAGADSIDLPEARVVIHYNLPWSWAKLIQRQNRAHRVNSKHESVYFYMLLMADSVEYRKVEIISTKLGFHNGVFKGEIGEAAISMRMTGADIWFMATGERYD